jgi:mRNA deadenylase 3'-5' endonuclease subunit Ccr4
MCIQIWMQEPQEHFSFNKQRVKMPRDRRGSSSDDTPPALRDDHVVRAVYAAVVHTLWVRAHSDPTIAADDGVSADENPSHNPAVPRVPAGCLEVEEHDQGFNDDGGGEGELKGFNVTYVESPLAPRISRNQGDGELDFAAVSRQEAPASSSSGFVSIDDLVNSPRTGGFLRAEVNTALRAFRARAERNNHSSPGFRKHAQRAVRPEIAVREAVIAVAIKASGGGSRFAEEMRFDGGTGFADLARSSAPATGAISDADGSALLVVHPHALGLPGCGFASAVSISRDNLRVRLRPWSTRLRGVLQQLFDLNRGIGSDVVLQALAVETAAEQARLATKAPVAAGNNEDQSAGCQHLVDAAAHAATGSYSVRVLFRRCAPIVAVFAEHPLVIQAVMRDSRTSNPGEVHPGLTDADGMGLLIGALKSIPRDVVLLPSPLSGVEEAPLLVRPMSLLERLTCVVEDAVSLWSLRANSTAMSAYESSRGFVSLRDVLSSKSAQRLAAANTRAAAQALSNYLQLRADSLGIEVSGLRVRSKAWRHFLNASGAADSLANTGAAEDQPPTPAMKWGVQWSGAAAGVEFDDGDRVQAPFVVLSFNVLVQIYCGEHAYCHPAYLRWAHRRTLFLDHIAEVMPDILLLQELQGTEDGFVVEAGKASDNGEFFRDNAENFDLDTARDLCHALSARGYTCVFARKSETSQVVDLGNALCFRADTFDMRTHGTISLSALVRGLYEGFPASEAVTELSVNHFSQLQVPVFAHLVHKQTSREVLPVCIHLSSHFDSNQLQVTQALMILRSMESISRNWTVPVILGGDFNAKSLDHSVCRLLATGAFGSDADSQPLPVGVVVPETAPLEKSSDGQRSHTLSVRFQSAYSACGGEPEATNLTASTPNCPFRRAFHGLLDYIWYIPGSLVPVATLDVPALAELQGGCDGEGLPCSVWPSDHVSIGAKFLFPDQE